MREKILICAVIFVNFLAFGQEADTVQITESKVRYDLDEPSRVPQFDVEKINEYKSGTDFNYIETEEETNWWQKFKSWLYKIWTSFWEWLLGENYENIVFLGWFIMILPYLIILGLVIFLIWLFYKLNPGATLFHSKQKPAVFLTEEEELIKTANLQELIEQALNNQDYRLAIRYSYLLLLQRLSDIHFIEYRYDKTNSDYVKEISQEAIASKFMLATSLYDHIWYGNFLISQPEYVKAESVFKQLQHLIPKEN